MSKEFFVESSTFKIYPEPPEDAEGEFVHISSVEDLTNVFKKLDLQKAMVQMKGREVASDMKKSAKKLAFEIYEATTGGGKKSSGGEAKPPKEKKPSKIGKLREMLTEKGTATKEELAEFSGYDKPNTHTAISILKNPKRTKVPVFTSYDRRIETYFVHETEPEMEADMERIKEEIAADKAKPAPKKEDTPEE